MFANHLKQFSKQIFIRKTKFNSNSFRLFSNASFPNYGKLDKVLLAGFGSIGKGMLPLILRHFDVEPKNVTVLDPEG